MPKVMIPTPLRNLTDGSDVVESAGTTIAEVLAQLDVMHPGIRDKLVDERGVRRFVNIYVGDEDIRFLDGINTPVKESDEISIIPAIAGGVGAAP